MQQTRLVRGTHLAHGVPRRRTVVERDERLGQGHRRERSVKRRLDRRAEAGRVGQLIARHTEGLERSAVGPRRDDGVADVDAEFGQDPAHTGEQAGLVAGGHVDPPTIADLDDLPGMRLGHRHVATYVAQPRKPG